MNDGIQNELTNGQRLPTTLQSFTHMRLSIFATMPNCCSRLTRWCCCRQQQPHDTYIYLYTPRLSSSSSSFHCLVCLIFAICLAFVLILTGAVIYHLNSHNISTKAVSDQRAIPISKKRQLPDFVNTNIDPCEDFYEFVCDKWTHRKKLETYEEQYERKWTRIRHRIHDTLMANISNDPSVFSESNSSSSPLLSVYQLYQLCETQSPALLINELESYFTDISQQEPYRSYLTLFNLVNSTNSTSVPIILQHNPFVQIFHPSSNNNNYSYSSIIPLHRRPLPPPLAIFSNSTTLNRTALNNLIKFENAYTKFLQESDSIIHLYEQEYNQDSLIVRRILTYSDYYLCHPSLNMANGLQNLIQLLNYFLQYRLRQFNTRLMDKQIRILDKLTDNHTLVEHLRRIRLEFQTIEQIIPFEYQPVEESTTCIIHLLDKLLDQRFQLNELPISIHLYSSNAITDYFISNDWPYLIMLYDRLLKNIPSDTLINFVFFDYYRHLVYPYYQPHGHHLIEFENWNFSCPIKSCFDIFNCYHPSLLNQLIDHHNQIFLDPIQTTIENVIHRFRSLIEQSDHLFSNDKTTLIKELNQMKILLGHYSSTFTPISNLNTSSYLEYVQYFSKIPFDQEEPSYSLELIYSSINHTLFIPYGFLYLSDNSIEYPLMHLLLKTFWQILQSNPFYIECLIKSFDDLNTTIIDTNNEHIIYLLFRSKFLSEENIIFDEYLWPFMSANSLMKQFLINYTADHYCHSLNTHRLYRNNTYLIDDVYLVFHCQQASSIKQSKCTVN